MNTKVPLQDKIRGGRAVVKQIEEIGTSSILSSKIEKPQNRFHELQIGAEDANWIITHYVYPRQRNVNLAWALEIGVLIDQGDLLPTTIHFAHCKEDEHTYLVDGYHRMAGTAMAKRSVIFPVEHHYCKTIDEVDDVYSKLDQGIPRTIGAAIRATGYAKTTGLPEHYIPCVAAAANVIAHQFNRPESVGKVRSSSRKLDMVSEWLDEATAFHSAVSGGNSYINDRLRSSANLAVILTCFRYQPDKAAKFFGDVARMTCEEGSGQQALLSSLMNKTSRKYNIPEACRIVANAWNAFYSGRSITRTYVQNPNYHIDILGTIWAGEKRSTSGDREGLGEQGFRDIKRANFRHDVPEDRVETPMA